MAKIDDVDTKILKELLKDGRKSFQEIAKECGVSCSSICDHYKEMEKAGGGKGISTQSQRWSRQEYHRPLALGRRLEYEGWRRCLKARQRQR